MPGKLIDVSPSAYQYPLLIKHLLHYPMAHAPDQEIVYRDLRRHSYRVFRERIGRLASGLAEIGVKPGDVVAVLDWDSHRYLECYFAVPMMGAVLQTVNLSLPPEALLFAMNDAAPSTVLVNADFLPLMEKIADKLPSVRKYVLLHDRKEQPTTRLPIECEYEEMLEANSPFFQFPDFDENTRATMFHTTGTTGRPKGVYFSHRQLVLHTLGITAEYGCAPSQGRIHRDDVYMPLTPMFHVHAWGGPYLYTMMGEQAGLSGALCAGCPVGIDRARGGDVHALRADDPADAALRAGKQGCRSLQAEDGGRRLGACRARWSEPRWRAASTSSPAMGNPSPARCCPGCI